MATNKRPVRRKLLSKPAKRKPASKTISSSSDGAVSAQGARARIRVYRHGLGDCILVRLRRRNGTYYKILIDCGVAMATRDAAAKMEKVVADIVRETGGKVDVLAVTHEHWDHVSGFTQAERLFKELEVGEVWIAWTEDADDPLAQSLRQEHARALAVLGASARAMAAAGRTERALGLFDIIGLVGAAGERTRAAFDKAKAMAGKRLYWQPDEKQQAPNQWRTPLQLEDADATIYALGPPYNAKAIRKTLPTKSNPETYELKLDGTAGLSASVLSALEEAERTPPFAPTVTIPMTRARRMRFFKGNYWSSAGGDADWRRIDDDWLGAADELALAMQRATNNTSLVLAIELSGTDVLLFAGDAQVGSWLSWQDRTWTVSGRVVTGSDLLERAVFYKVGHHGSHNATLKERGLNMMPIFNSAIC
jgi:beta-lactamase superfamily II metal-dependent hydrolase